ncbi:MAG: thioesterase family protein, partial [Calditrichota bacterium]
MEDRLKIIQPARLRVRYSEVDRMGMVYHVNYLEYFELARSEWIRQVWKPYREIEDAGYALVVIEVKIKFISSAKYDDELEIFAELFDVGRSRLGFTYRVMRPPLNEPLCTGSTRH